MLPTNTITTLTSLFIMIRIKLMTRDKDLYSIDDADWLYVTRKGGRDFLSIEDRVDGLIKGREHNTEKRGGRLITATRNNKDNTSII